MFRITLKSPVDGMTRIANRDLSYQRVSDKIHQCGQCQRSHREKGLASGKEIDAGDNSQTHDGHPYSTVEIFLDIQSVMAAGYTGSYDAAVRNGVVHEQREFRIAVRAKQFARRGGGNSQLAVAGPALEMYNWSHEASNGDIAGRRVRSSRVGR